MGKISKRNLRMVFFGTPELAVYALEELAEAGVRPTLVVTVADRPAGRGMKLTAPPVKVWAEREGIDVLQPEKASAPEFLDELGNSEWDLFIVAAYGKLLPKRLLEMPRLGTLNIHPSLLPKLRGPSPIVSAILTDAKDAVGVTVIKLDEEMDHGPIVAAARIELEDWPLPSKALGELLFREGGRLLAEALPDYALGNTPLEAQDHAHATLCAKFGPEDAELELDGDPWQNFLKIRAFDVSPRAHFFAEHDGKMIRVIVTDATYEEGKLTITRVIPEGKKEMSYEEFLQSV